MIRLFGNSTARPPLASIGLVAAALVLVCGAAIANADEERAGRLINVPLPISGEVDTRVERAIERALENLPKSNPRPVIVLEFTPRGSDDGLGSKFERSLALARFLVSEKVSRVRVVAYVPKVLRGHAVLVALACEQIIVSPDAVFGEAGVDESNIDQTMRRGYTEIANRRKTIPAPVALGMLDREVTVSKVNGDRFVLDEELQELRAAGTAAQVETVIPAGEYGLFGGRDMRLRHGLATHMVSGRDELAQILNVAAGDLEFDPTQGEAWRGMLARIDGPINARLVDQLQHGIEERLQTGNYNLVVVAIDSPGGDAVASSSLAGYLSALDSSEVRTVGFIEGEARGDVVMLAMACDHLVMAETAKLGGSGRRLSDDEIADAVYVMRETIAPKKARGWSVWAAMLDPELTVNRCVRLGGGSTAYFSETEREEQGDPEAWKILEGREITIPGQPLELTGVDAEGLSLVRFRAASLDELQDLYGIESELESVKPNWAYELIEALATSQVAWTLLFIGAFALMSEAMSPGIGIGGFLAGICFLLFFWSQFLNGTAGWLEVLLFVAGVVCLALEIFVVPGFGIFGLGGGTLLLASVVLATQTFIWPHNEYQYGQLVWSLGPILAVIGGVMAALVVMPRFLPKTPVVNQMVLAPPAEEELEELTRRQSLTDFERLVGKSGTTTTQLMPSGKALFGDELIDVISDGEVIPRDTSIVVIEVHGNRVVVRSVG
jgi:membrane-bound serine protease (ClpP class)